MCTVPGGVTPMRGTAGSGSSNPRHTPNPVALSQAISPGLRSYQPLPAGT
jgi:hypothetical protein